MILKLILIITIITSLYVVKWKNVRMSVDRVLYREYNISIVDYIRIDQELEKSLEETRDDLKYLYNNINNQILDNFIHMKLFILDILFLPNKTMRYEEEKGSLVIIQLMI